MVAPTHIYETETGWDSALTVDRGSATTLLLGGNHTGDPAAVSGAKLTVGDRWLAVMFIIRSSANNITPAGSYYTISGPWVTVDSLGGTISGTGRVVDQGTYYTLYGDGAG